MTAARSGSTALKSVYREATGAAGGIGANASLPAIRADIGMVFQLFNLFPHLTAAENVMLGLLQGSRPSEDDAYDRAEHWLTRVGLADRME